MLRNTAFSFSFTSLEHTEHFGADIQQFTKLLQAMQKSDTFKYV